MEVAFEAYSQSCFWSVFPYIRTEFKDLLRKFLYSLRKHFSRNIIRNTIKNSVIQVIDETGDLIVGYFLFQN